MKIAFGTQLVDLTSENEGYTATASDRTVHVTVLQTGPGWIELRVDDRLIRAHLSSDGPHRWVTVNGRTARLTKSAGSRGGRGRHEHAGGLSAPMPGQVKSIAVGAGDAVHKGQTLIVLEAMKMEMRVQSPQDGRVRAVHVRPGQTVEREQILIEVEE